MIGKTSKGVYFYRIYVKNAFGKSIPVRRQNAEWKTKKQAQEALDLYRLQLKENVTDITVGQLFKLYDNHRRTKLKLKSIYTSTNVYETHIKPFFENKKVQDISNRDIVEWQRALLNQGYRNRYLENIQSMLKSIFNFGVQHDYISTNPFKIEMMKNKEEIKEEMQFWTLDEFNKFISYIDDPMYEAFFKLLYWAGLREGEALALLKSDINFLKGTVSISKTYDRVHHIVTSPKTSASYGTIALPDVVLEALQRHLETYKQIDGYNENIILFGFNRYLSPKTIKRRQEEACKLSKVKVIRIHDLRHSHVSLLIYLGLSPFEIAKRLRHSVEMVNNVYGHLFPEKEQLILSKLNNLQNRPLENTSKN